MSILPVEIIQEILSHCSKDSLARCALANNTTLIMARRFLYHSIRYSLANPCSPPVVPTIASPNNLLSNTIHIVIANRIDRPEFLPLLSTLIRVGRLESFHYAGTHIADAQMDGLIHRLISLLSLKRFRASFIISLPYELSPLMKDVLASPMLRDLTLSPSFPTHSIRHLDTVRFGLDDWEKVIPILSSNFIRRIEIEVSLWTPNLDLAVHGMTECLSKESVRQKVLYLAIHPRIPPLSPNNNVFSSLFVPLRGLLFLRVLSILIDTRSEVGWNVRVEFLHAVLESTPASLREIHIFLWDILTLTYTQKVRIQSDPIWLSIQGVLQSRHPKCTLIVYTPMALEFKPDVLGRWEIRPYEIGTWPFWKEEATDDF